MRCRHSQSGREGVRGKALCANNEVSWGASAADTCIIDSFNINESGRKWPLLIMCLLMHPSLYLLGGVWHLGASWGVGGGGGSVKYTVCSHLCVSVCSEEVRRCIKSLPGTACGNAGAG